MQNGYYMNSKNSTTSVPQRLLVNFTDKKADKYVALSNLSIYYTKKLYENNKFKISAPAWNEQFELHDGSYSISDIQDFLNMY